MNLKKVILSDISTEAKVSAIAILLDKELPKLTEKVDTVKKLKGEQGERGLQGDKGDTGKNGKDGKNKNGQMYPAAFLVKHFFKFGDFSVELSGIPA